MKINYLLNKKYFGMVLALSTALSASSPVLEVDTSSNSLRIVNIPSADNIIDSHSTIDLSSRKPSCVKDDSAILTAPEEEQIAFLKSAGYLEINIFNALAYGRDPMKDRFRTTPLAYLIPKDVVRKFYFQRSYWKYSDYEGSYAKYNTVTDRSFDQYVDEIFSTKYFGIPEKKAERKKYFLESDFSFLSQKNITSVFTAAKGILKATSREDNIVIFGNTPYFVGRALQMLAEENPEIKRNIIIFPFSGSPNSVRPNNFPNNNDIVTSENLSHLKKRLRGHGLMADNPELLTKETYFVDCIASGSGPAYTIETILRDFQEQGVKETPKFKIIALNEFTFEDDGEEAYVCEERLEDIEREFYKKGERA